MQNVILAFSKQTDLKKLHINLDIIINSPNFWRFYCTKNNTLKYIFPINLAFVIRKVEFILKIYLIIKVLKVFA